MVLKADPSDFNIFPITSSYGNMIGFIRFSGDVASNELDLLQDTAD